MRLRGQDDDQIDVRLTVDELVLLKNMLNEVCNGMNFSDNDFQTIFGFSKAEAEGLLIRATGVLERLRLLSE